MDNMNALEMDPQWMGGVTQSAVSEGIGREEVTELVVDARLGHSHKQRKGRIQQERDDADQYDGPRPVSCDPAEETTCPMEPSPGGPFQPAEPGGDRSRCT